MYYAKAFLLFIKNEMKNEFFKIDFASILQLLWVRMSLTTRHTIWNIKI